MVSAFLLYFTVYSFERKLVAAPRLDVGITKKGWRREVTNGTITGEL
jgi:hypothetical protein